MAGGINQRQLFGNSSDIELIPKLKIASLKTDSLTDYKWNQIMMQGF
jgi:hypothetical protein